MNRRSQENPSLILLFLIRVQLTLVTAFSSSNPLKLFHYNLNSNRNRLGWSLRKGKVPLFAKTENSRRNFNQELVLGTLCGFTLGSNVRESDGLISESERVHYTESLKAIERQQIGYSTFSLPIPSFDCSIPVALWFPTDDGEDTNKTGSKVRYHHRISVKRIGQLLAGWNFIPDFVSRNFEFGPSIATLSASVKKSKGSNVVLIAHGYLGSRFDLSHIAEDLASHGFVCISPEYPESLAASYTRKEGLDRGVINQHLLSYVENNFQPSSYAGIGHSLGCGTILRVGDDSWTRVLIAGRPPEPSTFPLLFISSTNDCTVRYGGPLQIPKGYLILSESKLPLNEIPRTSALIFDRQDGPNHISYLSENVNESMISFLSPLLPIAQLLSIPVLDFDKYQKSRDSKETAPIVLPLIRHFLSQHTKSKSTSG